MIVPVVELNPTVHPTETSTETAVQIDQRMARGCRDFLPADTVILRPSWKCRNLELLYSPGLLRDILEEDVVEIGATLRVPTASSERHATLHIVAVRPNETQRIARDTHIIFAPALPPSLANPFFDIPDAWLPVQSALLCALGPRTQFSLNIIARPGVVLLTGQAGVGRSAAIAACTANAGAVLLRYSAADMMSRAVSKDQKRATMEQILRDAQAGSQPLYCLMMPS